MTVTNHAKYQFIQGGIIVTDEHFGEILGAGATKEDAVVDVIYCLNGIFGLDEIRRASRSFIYTPATAAAIATVLNCHESAAYFFIDNGPDGWDTRENLEAHGYGTVSHALKYFERRAAALLPK